MRYDKAIQNIGLNEVARVEDLGNGVVTVTGDDLDALYEDWVSKARAVVGCTCTNWPCGGLSIYFGLCECKICHVPTVPAGNPSGVLDRDGER